MATYTVSYRNKNGERIEEQFEAPDRNSLFNILADRKISAISVKDGAAPKRKKSSAPSKPLPPSVIRGIIAGLVVIFVLGGVLFLLSCKEEPNPEPVGKKVEKIAEVTPAKIVKPKPVVEEEDLGWVTNRKGQVVKRKRPETYRDERGVLRYVAGGARAPEKDEFKNAVRVMTPTTHPDFKHSCENEIATLITTEPGDMLFGTPRYDERFKQDFVQALMEPIEILPEDSERDRTIKQMVEEQKRELAERIKEGEDLETIFTEAREEARRLAAIKAEVLQMTAEATADGDMSEEDVETYYQAANKMLEAKGVLPVKYEGLMKRRMRLMSIRNTKETNE